jgi:DegV family protein with EDD domain
VNAPAVRIVTDSSCDLPHEIVDELGISVVPLTIRIDDRDYLDRVELSPAEFWAKCAASPTLPETAAPAPGQFAEVYERLAAEGAEEIVVVTLSSALSATMQSAEVAGREAAIPVHVVDGRSVSLALGLVVVDAARRAAAGERPDDIVRAAAARIARTKLLGALDSLDNLKKGGRIGGAAALLASALSIKPIVELRDGKVEQAGKQRTRSKALAHVVETMAACAPLESVAVLHADCADVDAFVEMVRRRYAGELFVGDVGPVVGTHAGKGTIGVAFTVAGPAT